MKTLPPIRAVLLLSIVAGLSGCVSNKNATIMPGANLGPIKNYYVVHLPADDRKVNQLIAEDLTRRGFQASTGEANDAPLTAEALVTYYDKWMWDITMYLLQLDIQIRNPKTQAPLATGIAMHSSLGRRSPPEMVKEVLDEIFSKAGQPTASAAK
jgi:hypothetical protein